MKSKGGEKCQAYWTGYGITSKMPWERKHILNRDTDNMERNPYSAEGKFDRTYKEKESNHRNATKALANTYRQSIADIKTQLSAAQAEYEYWCSEAEREDREMKVYEKRYYEELEKEQKAQKGA